MHADLKKYLDTMANKIKNKTARENARLEIENHLLDQIEAGIERGLSEDQSIEKVLKSATPPKELGAKLNLAHKTFILRYPLTLVASSLMVICFISTVMASYYVVDKYFAELLHRNLVPKFQTLFREDLEVIAHSNLPLPSKIHKNNGIEFVVSHIGWQEGEVYKYFKKLDGKINGFKKDLHISMDSKLWKNSSLVKKLAETPYFLNMNLVWVDEILNYDYINHLEHPENRKIFEESLYRSNYSKQVALVTYKIPFYNTFSSAIKYRALQLIIAGNSQKAEELLLHSFSLFQSTNSLVGNNIIPTVLSVHQSLNEIFKLNWRIIPKRSILAYRRIGWGWTTVIANAITAPNSLQEWKMYLSPEFGLCAGFSETASYIYFYKSYFQEKFIFETDHQDFINLSSQMTFDLAKKCDGNEFAKLLSNTSTEDNFFNGEYYFVSDYAKYFPNLSRIPYIRRIAGVFLMMTAFPEYDSIYLQDKEPDV